MPNFENDIMGLKNCEASQSSFQTRTYMSIMLSLLHPLVKYPIGRDLITMSTT